MNSPTKSALILIFNRISLPTFSIFMLLTSTFVFSQKHKPFEGAIYYDVFLYKHPDSLPVKVNYLTLRIKDSLVRIDTNSDAFGGQTTIKNINRKRSYTLLKSQQGEFYAIRNVDTSTVHQNFSFKKIRKSKKIGTYKITAVERIDAQGESDTIYYFPKISPIYLGIFYGIKGLPAAYSVPINKDSYLYYQVIKVEPELLDPKLFTIPSLFKIITMEEFINKM